MKQQDMTRTSRAALPVSKWRAFSLSMTLFATLTVAGGMTGGSCVDFGNTIPGGGAPGAGSFGPDEGPQLLPQDHVLVLDGADPKVTVFEYSDLNCAACGFFARTQLDDLIADYVDTGKIQFVFRHLPNTTTHPHAESAAIASECADEQGLFWEFKALVFEDVGDGVESTDERLRELADQLGMDLETYDACLSDATKKRLVDDHRTSGQALGIATTPTFFINGERAAGVQLEGLGPIIDRKLNELEGE